MANSVVNFVEQYKLQEEFKNACKNGDIKSVQRLLTNPKLDPANGAKGSYWYQEPFKLACSYGHTEVVRLLLQDPRIDPTNVQIEFLVPKGYTEIVHLLLLDGRANPARLGYQTTLEIACSYGQPEIVRLLLQDPRVNPYIARATAIGEALRKSGNGQIEAVKIMLADPRVNPQITPEKAKILATIPVSELRDALYLYQNRFEQLLLTLDHLLEKKLIKKAARNLKTLKATSKNNFGNLPENIRLKMGSIISGKVGPNLQSQINQLKANYYGPTRQKTRKRILRRK